MPCPDHLLLQVVALTQEVSTLTRQGRLRHEQLVEEITKALQTKDDALRRLRQVEAESKRAADASYQSQQVLSFSLLLLRLSPLLTVAVAATSSLPSLLCALL
jgi:hypothetical protein